MNIQIREAEPEDAFAIAKVHIASWHAAYKGIVAKEWLDRQELDDRAANWLENINTEKDKKKKNFLAFSGDQLAAFATIGQSRSEAYSDYAELWAIYAAPAFYGKGAGKALFNHCAAYAREIGYSKMFVNVLRDNDLGRNFYERTGATVIPDSQEKASFGEQEYEIIKYEWKELGYDKNTRY